MASPQWRHPKLPTFIPALIQSPPCCTHPDVLTVIYRNIRTHIHPNLPTLRTPKRSFPYTPQSTTPIYFLLFASQCAPTNPVPPLLPTVVPQVTQVIPQCGGRAVSPRGPRLHWPCTCTPCAPRCRRAAPSPCAATPPGTPRSTTTGCERTGGPYPRVLRAADKVLGGSRGDIGVSQGVGCHLHHSPGEELHFPSIQPSEAGVYVCSCRNLRHSNASRAEVIVTGR